jgi:transmembrane sensor
MSEGQTPIDPETQASRWLVRLESPDVSREDHRRFAEWMNASHEHRLAFEAVSATWDRLDGLRRLPSAPGPVRARRNTFFAGAALAVAIGAALLMTLAPWRSHEAYATAIGEHRTITFADGSTAELNAGTRLHVVFSRSSRRVTLDDGEALFDVRPDAKRPFVVETRFGNMRVRGTSFVVRLMSQEARTTVIRGQVECDSAPAGLFASILLAPFAAAARSMVAATTNDEIDLSRSGIERRPLQAPMVLRRLAWREGMLSFDGERLVDAAGAVARQTGVRFSFANAQVEDIRVGGYIGAKDVSGFVRLVEMNLHLDAERLPDGAIRFSARTTH